MKSLLITILLIILSVGFLLVFLVNKDIVDAKIRTQQVSFYSLDIGDTLDVNNYEYLNFVISFSNTWTTTYKTYICPVRSFRGSLWYITIDKNKIIKVIRSKRH